MSQQVKVYEMDAVRLRFAPEGGPMEGILSVEFPEQEPYTQHLSLAKPRSQKQYANAAAQHNGIDGEILEKLLVDLCSARFEEIEAAQEIVQGAVEGPEECLEEVSAEEVEALVGHPGVLDRFVEDAARIHGVVGEREPLKLLTLNAFGAQLEPLPNGKPRGANLVLTAEWGRGKNHLADSVATLLPEDFYLAFESASAKSLFYRAEEDPKILAHRWIYLNEAEAMDQLVEMLRPLLSGGKVSHLTVNRADGQNVAQELRVEGPVTITIPTIRNKLDPQLQSRLLTADLPDYEGRVARHSRATSKLLLPGYDSEDYSPRIRGWQAALESLTAVRRVVFPLDEEGFCFDRDDVSHGARLWTNVLGLMCAHALLEQRNREVMTLLNGEQAIVATPADYEAAYNVFKATCERSVQNLSDAHRKILNGLYELKTKAENTHWSKRENSWSQRAIERHTGVAQSTISAQRSYLVKSLKLVLEDPNGKLRLAEDVDPALWETDDALDGFPRPAQVWAWWNGDGDPPDPETPGHTQQGHEASESNCSSEENGGQEILGHCTEAPGQPTQDKAAHHDDQPENPADLHASGTEDVADQREDTSESDSSGATNGMGEHHEEEAVGEEDEGHLYADGEDHGWRDRYLREMERRLGAGWENEPPGVLLAKLGWARYEGLPTTDDAKPENPWAVHLPDEDKWKLKQDPIVRKILEQVCIYTPEYGLEGWMATDAELSAPKREHEDMGGVCTIRRPDLRETRERLLEMLPKLLETTWRVFDPEKEGYDYELSEASLYRERWEKEGEDEGLWFFTALKTDLYISREEVEANVWFKVRSIEGLTEEHYSPQPDVFKFGD